MPDAFELQSISYELTFRIVLNLVGAAILAWGWSPAARFWSKRFAGTELSRSRSWLIAFVAMLVWAAVSAGVEALVRTATSLRFGDFALAWRGWTTFAGGFGLTLLIAPFIIRRVVITASGMTLAYCPRLKIVLGTLGPLFAMAVVFGATWQWMFS